MRKNVITIISYVLYVFINKYRKLCTLHPGDFFDFEQFKLKKNI